jgi:hypothetical protein
MPMVEKSLGIFSNKNNDTDILLNQIMKKDYVFIRDKPAIDHLVIAIQKTQFLVLMNIKDMLI